MPHGRRVNYFEHPGEPFVFHLDTSCRLPRDGSPSLGKRPRRTYGRPMKAARDLGNRRRSQLERRREDERARTCDIGTLCSPAKPQSVREFFMPAHPFGISGPITKPPGGFVLARMNCTRPTATRLSVVERLRCPE